MRITWDNTGERLYETGVDHGVLYIPEGGTYSTGVAWNGLSTVTESPSGAESNPVYADNIKYLNLVSVEEFGGTIEAYTYPDEFIQFDGGVVLSGGVRLAQQSRKSFGLSYRTRLGNDVDGDDYGYKIHLVYGAQASPSERAYASVNDSPEAIAFSWEFSTTPVAVTGHKPTSLVTIDSTKVDADDLAALELILYGSTGVEPRLPLPDEVIALFAGTATAATPTEPTFDPATGVITIPNDPEARYFVDGEEVVGTVQVADGDTVMVVAQPANGYYFEDNVDNDWSFTNPAGP